VTLRPVRPHRIVTANLFGGHRLASILGANVGTEEPVGVVRDTSPPTMAFQWPFPTVTYMDARTMTPVWQSAGDLAIHVLWTSPRVRPHIQINFTHEPANQIDHPCAPGDFLLVPGGTAFRIGAGIVAVIVGTADLTEVDIAREDHVDQIAHFAPTHGLNVFNGYNRQTFGVASSSLVISRWKLTQPQNLNLPCDRPSWISNLVTPVSIAWPGGMERLERTEGRFVPPGLPITVYPHDLGYVLVAWQPDLGRDVVPPLRSAGYTQAEIGALGIPQTLLETRTTPFA
jgi:hypothetical protein